MAEQSRVPQFGNWEGEMDVHYTAYFDKARRERPGGQIINPNNAQQNPDYFADSMPQAQPAPSETNPKQEEFPGQGAVKPTPEPHVNIEDGGTWLVSESLARHDHMGHRGTHGVNSGETNRRPSRPSGGSHSADRSPLHPHFQGGRTPTRGSRVSSPSWEGKNIHENSHGNPGRSRLKPAKSDDSLDKSAAVPKFGDWNEANPSTADGFTEIFDKVRAEKHAGETNSPGVVTEPSGNPRKPNMKGSDKGCCFPWWKK